MDGWWIQNLNVECFEQEFLSIFWLLTVLNFFLSLSLIVVLWTDSHRPTCPCPFTSLCFNTRPSTCRLSAYMWESWDWDSVSVVSSSWWRHGLGRARLLCPWDSPGKNTGVGCRSLLQGSVPTRGLNLHLLCCRQALYHWATRETKLLKGGSFLKQDYLLIVFNLFPF